VNCLELLVTLKCLNSLQKHYANSNVFVTISEKDLEIEDLQARLEHYSRMKDPGGSTYVRWGRTTCPETSEIV